MLKVAWYSIETPYVLTTKRSYESATRERRGPSAIRRLLHVSALTKPVPEITSPTHGAEKIKPRACLVKGISSLANRKNGSEE